MKIRRSRKLSKFSLELPQDLIDQLDYLADEVDTTRSDAIRTILLSIMDSEDLIDMIFGEALEEHASDEDEDEEEDDSETEDEAEGESEAETSAEPISEQKEGY
jgi:metal-responsive CopG/Arc/MetJ family transcriptional regulator